MYEVQHMPRDSIKEEPFGEFYVPESVLQSVDGIAESDVCCLCPVGSRLQSVLFEHIQNAHPENVTFCEESRNLSCCFCAEGVQIQMDLINHILSHFSVKNEIDFIRIDSNPDEVLEIELHPKRQANRKKSDVDDEDLEIAGRSTKRSRRELLSAKVHCEHCPKVFKYKQGANKHYELEHNPQNLFQCTKPNCESRCRTLKNLHAHLRTHDPPKDKDLNELQCQKCLKVFPTRKQLSLHHYTHREKFFCCDTCGSRFNNRQQIKKHVMRHVGLFHQKISHQRIICDQCSMMVYTHKMKRHKLIHHSDLRPFKCDFPGCEGSFSDNRMLKDHKNIHLKLKPYVCEYCSESFRSGANLRQHRLRHTNPEKYRCEECQTSFVTKQSLQKHNRRHTEDPDIRPYACDYPDCSSTFKQRDHVRNHFRRIHFKTNEVYSCELCAKSYNRKDVLRKHLRRAHNIAKKQSRVFPQAIQ